MWKEDKIEDFDFLKHTTSQLASKVSGVTHIPPRPIRTEKISKNDEKRLVTEHWVHTKPTTSYGEITTKITDSDIPKLRQIEVKATDGTNNRIRIRLVTAPDAG